MDHQREAERIISARARRETLMPITDTQEMSMADAYDIQRRMTAARLARGERIAGWKLGYTSKAMRSQMGIDQPNFGPLTDQMVLDDGALLPGTVVQPKVEPEVALRFARPLTGECSIEEVLDATETAHACLEIVDTVWTDYRFRIEDNTADGSSAAFICIGAPIPIATINTVTVELRRNGEPVGHGVGADASGHPALGVVWLAAQLAEQRTGIRAGDIVITGGLTRAVDFVEGDIIDALYDGKPAVSVRR
ncbi:MAG TPA: fumarylacetoacetate hydrolase family protein [Ilumatobacteraceae bacterium]|nr:fumarylacetoacetate hydrolase family protein [Ilumatobacteraceae bacterium]